MKKYKVIAKSVTYCYIEIEANNQDEAIEIAQQLDGGEFTEEKCIDSGYFEIIEECTEEVL